MASWLHIGRIDTITIGPGTEHHPVNRAACLVNNALTDKSRLNEGLSHSPISLLYRATTRTGSEPRRNASYEASTRCSRATCPNFEPPRFLPATLSTIADSSNDDLGARRRMGFLRYAEPSGRI